VLETFGVSPLAERVYLAMLQHPDVTARGLADTLDLSESAIHASFDELARMSLLRPSWGDPGTLRPVAPELGLQSLLTRQEADLLGRKQQIEQGRAALAVLVAETARGSSETQTEVEELTGIDAIRDRLEQLTSETRFEVLSFAPGGAQTAAARTSSRPLDQQLLERGVSMRTVYLDSVRNDPPTVAYATWLSEQGGQVRTVNTLPLRMIIVDRESAVVPLNPTLSDVGATVLRGSGAVAAMCALFDQIWSAATPLGVARPRDERGLSAQERGLLQLLADGDTDSIAARKLGVSDRTVRRLISNMMEQLGARSRFQAGVRARDHGWVPGSAPGTVADSDA
jgi:DNA-binding CsgD family transcriptional regulator/sugar-specific transcriptional regulator TrmB